MRIAKVAFRGFPPFADAIMEFPERPSDRGAGEVQLLTGQNGTGKTRLLCLLAAACGGPAALNARIASKEGKLTAVVGEDSLRLGVCWPRKSRAFWPGGPIDKDRDIVEQILRRGQSFGPGGESSALNSTPGEDVPITAALAFRGMARVADAKISAMAPVELQSPAEHLTFEPARNEDQIICQSMANLKMSAAMDVLRRSERTQSRAIKLVETLEHAVSRITGREFAFNVTPHPEVRLRVFWGRVEMNLLQLPDGLRSIIGWLVSCVSKLDALFPDHPDPLSLPLILLLDEPEGHLHPAWQRKVLPAAQILFPQAQIFAATHSPFVISSVNDGWIHIFRADEAGAVTVDRPRPCSKGDTYLDVVEDILGVREWYDPETEGLLAQFRETRDAVIAGGNGFEDLETQAEAIAERSTSPRELMAREMRQVERLTPQPASRP